MSKFGQIFDDFEKKKSSEDGEKKKQAEAKQSKVDEFMKTFQTTAGSWMPILQDFVKAATERGYTAHLDTPPGAVKDSVQVRFIAEPGVKGSHDRSQESVFQIRALPEKEAVEIASYFDQRVGRPGVEKKTISLYQLETRMVEEALRKWQSDALHSRRMG